jgi:hypothetical protein
MLDAPTPVEILEVVAAMIRDQLVPQLPPDAVFHARVAANAIDLVRRQLLTGDALEAASLSRLQQLLGHQGDAPALERELCERIRNGSLTTASPKRSKPCFIFPCTNHEIRAARACLPHPRGPVISSACAKRPCS